MHIIVIAWLFVALMIAIGQRSVVGGLISFFMWGLVPVGLLLYIFARRRPSSAQHSDATDGHNPPQA